MSRAGDGRDRRPKRLPEDACPTCGTTMVATTADLPLPVNGETVRVAGIAHLACPSCGEVLLSAGASRVAQEQAVEAYRQLHDLLKAVEIRALRQRLGMTQAEFASLLHLGMNTVSRWESGRNVQTVALDLLLKLVRDVPGTLEYLKGRAA